MRLLPRELLGYLCLLITTVSGVCDDVAIIGAGPAGSYAAWRLRHRNLSISVFEFSNRPGGRLYTAQFPEIPDINVEFGGMRFLPEEHVLVDRTLRELGLKVVDFAPGKGAQPSDHVHFRGVQMTYGELGGARTPYRLTDTERLSPEQLEWELFVNHTNFDVSTDVKDEDALYRLRTSDGLELYKQSRELMISKMASREGQSYLESSLRWGFYKRQSPRAYIVPTQPSKSHKTTLPVKTVASGYDDLPKTLLRQFQETSTRQDLVIVILLLSDWSVIVNVARTQLFRAHADSDKTNVAIAFALYGKINVVSRICRYFDEAKPSLIPGHRVKYNHQLTEVKKDESGLFRLQFLATETKNGVTQKSMVAPGYHHCARNVILAVPRMALTRIASPQLESEEIRDLIHNAVADFPLGKLFLTYRSAWWRDLVPNFRRSRSDLPLQNSYDFGTSPSTNLSVFLAGYFDSENVRLFEESNRYGEYIPGIGPDNLKVSNNTVHLATRFLSDIFNIREEDIPSPVSGAMMTWTKFPFGGGLQNSMPGYVPTQVQRRMLRPVPDDNLFIATNGFVSKETRSWVESAFLLVEDILKIIDIV